MIDHCFIVMTEEVAQDPERRRFLMELEFVQCLANPEYIKSLAQSDYFADPAFINYLRYLLYWQKPEYAKFVRYPHALHFLVLLQDETFREHMVDTGFVNHVHQQQLYHWKFYRKHRTDNANAAEEEDEQDKVKPDSMEIDG